MVCCKLLGECYSYKCFKNLKVFLSQDHEVLCWLKKQSYFSTDWRYRCVAAAACPVLYFCKHSYGDR